ncbi:MAG: formylglycine-generating enzyme family protein [Nitrospinae bacterium]|nr:formylglycine-generating enzyme family protein [Nitrospinota bacterium]
MQIPDANFCDSNYEFDWKSKNQNDGYKNTSPVKQYKPNGVGLYDMTGNVWEWCSDWYDVRYYSESLKNNPKGPSSGQYKMYRGGAWNNIPWHMRASSRNEYERSDRNTNLGFRLVLTTRRLYDKKSF